MEFLGAGVSWPVGIRWRFGSISRKGGSQVLAKDRCAFSQLVAVLLPWSFRNVRPERAAPWIFYIPWLSARSTKAEGIID